MSLSSDLRDRAFRWIADDPDPATRTELQQVTARAMGGDPAAVDELADRMNGTLTFGTAGLRGPVRAGSNGMNRAVVLRATVRRGAVAGAQGPRGRHGDRRPRRAPRFGGVRGRGSRGADGGGFSVRTMPGPLPTPVTAFHVRALGAVAGIQVTASHNPPADNGYKVYAADGAQIVPPDDGLIETAIRSAPPARSVPVAPGAVPLTDVSAYVARVASLPRGTARDLRVVLTPMHGVGGATAVEALRAAGFTDVRLVDSQAEPDPDFPTVAFPNPEEPGAADRLLALASEVDADLAIALDPDADRCALGVRDAEGWRMLRGDETGVLLGEYVLTGTHATNPLTATTIVSSSMLSKVAAAHGARHAETLTGFKWLMRAGDGLVFAYEEALGLSVDPDFVRDKDGISAAVLACELVATLKAGARTPLDVLDDLYVQHGVHLTDQVSLRFADMSAMAPLVAALRANPPSTLAGMPVTQDNPAPDIVRLRGEGVRVVVRPSGTEPKVKAYLEVVAPVEGDVAAAEPRRRQGWRTLREEVRALLKA